MRIDKIPADAPLCASGKRPFRTEADAQANLAAAHRNRRNDSTGGRRPGVVEGNHYQCPTCKWWHLSSSPRAQRRSVLGNAKNGRTRRS